MNTAQITQLLAIGQLAIDLHNEKNAANQVKEVYHRRLRDSGEEFDGLNPDKEGYEEVLEFSKVEYEAYQAAKRRVYNIQRRLDNACRKAAMLGLGVAK